jgi:26S proteasome regulatory subunit N5
MLESLREACEGKMFLEREYSQATMVLCKYLEEDGKADEGTNIIQEIQIETYGSLEVSEKVEFILYQMKLVLMRKDFVRCQILSKKISKRHLSGKGLEKHKIQFFLFMIQYHVHEKMILDAAKAYQTIFDVVNKAEPELAKELDPNGLVKQTSFQNFVIYLLISPYDNEKVDLMHILESMYARNLEDNDLLGRFVHKLLTFELIPLNEPEIEQQMSQFEPFKAETENHKAHMRDLIRQLIQHNLRVIEKYYSKINISTLSRLIGVPEDRAEQEICDMVVNKRIQAKINRLAWQVAFKKKNQNTEGMLDDWNRDVKTLLDKVE